MTKKERYSSIFFFHFFKKVEAAYLPRLDRGGGGEGERTKAMQALIAERCQHGQPYAVHLSHTRSFTHSLSLPICPYSDTTVKQRVQGSAAGKPLTNRNGSHLRASGVSFVVPTHPIPPLPLTHLARASPLGSTLCHGPTCLFSTTPRPAKEAARRSLNDPSSHSHHTAEARAPG